ncbi:MAG TPA: hypothetical protein VGL06_02975 [Pseudonocardiaceae bacterium]
MDRPRSGHRRHDTGSITVVDLIRRQQGPVRIPSADETDTVQFVSDLLGPADTTDTEVAGHEHRSWLARSAKLAGLAVGSLALCGSMVVAAELTHHRTAATVTRPATTVLTGVGALRPDTVAAALSGPRIAPPTPAAHPSVPTVASGRETGTIVGGPPAAPPAPPLAQPATGSTAAGVVRTFYRLVGSDPTAASTLIDPSLLAADPIGFAQAWSALSRIDIESIQQTSAGTVQAVIRMRQPDGTWLRVVEQLHVTDGSSPVIDGAELLSAQRS